MDLERYLALNKYFLNLFGFDDFNDLRENLKDTQESFDSEGRSYFVDVLIGLKSKWEVQLLRYDEAVCEYVKRLTKNRKEPNFNLKYFQYLAVLFTEIFLDKYYNDRQNFVDELNVFLEKFNNKNGTEITPFTEEDLEKLAFWMATGSGKTLIMHINYWQILKYSKNDWDNIILITPNEGLSKQHYEELKLSGIPCKLYDGNVDSLKTKDREILVIDIYKLTKEKKGEGASVDISYFDGKNLVFIDEGHKGQQSEEQKWKRLREEIGRNGFLFEYSATFGQVIGNNNDLLQEYAKAIIFDYSYKYFYTDGYGKDFYTYNIKADREGDNEYYSEEKQNLLLVAGLLSFYEQLLIFEENKNDLRKYNIEKPLWIFVGSKVTGKGINSDVVKVTQFLNRITNNGYLKEKAEKILNGNAGLVGNDGNDIFKGKFQYIRRNYGIDSLVDDIYQKVFGGTGGLELHEIKNAEGEIGLKTSTAEKYFGVINVGDVGTLRKLILESGIEVKEEDHFSQSLFLGLNEVNSNINVLIGSKKFIEGWNSWRVSSMGLINMGMREGPQIIQLFGRGVRLKGENYSLKRQEIPDYNLRMLQTLFIFGLNADYINTFLTTIEKEGANYEEIAIPIKFNNPEQWEDKIYTIKAKDDFDFINYPVKLAVDNDILSRIKIDLRPKITIAHGLNVGVANAAINNPLTIHDEYFELIDWNFVYSEVMNYKIANGMYNLIIDEEAIKKIVKSKAYEIFLSELAGMNIENINGRLVLKINSFEGVKRFHDIILMVIKDYIVKFYRKEEKIKTMDYLEAEPLTINKHSSMYPEGREVILKIPKNLVNDIKEVKEQLNEWVEGNIPDQWRDWQNSYIIHLDNHLYTPLIIWKQNKEEIKSVPVKLNEGETKFVSDFKNFLNGGIFGNSNVFLLRNLSKKGIGFFVNSGFYPDFIVWIKKENRQHMIFIDPKGIRNLGNFNDDKIQFCTSYIKKIEEKINEELKNKEEKIYLQDAFILSISSYEDIRNTFGEGNYTRGDFEEHNIVFQEDTEYIEKIIERIGVIKNN